MTERYHGKAALVAAFLFLLAFGMGGAHASVDISPIRLDLSETHTRDILHFGNQGDSEKSYEIEVMRWTQSAEGKDEYEPTDDLVAVPPVFTLEPGQEQVIRVGMLADADPDAEIAYRVFITELAPPQPDTPAASGVSMRLRLGVPVFVAPSGGSTANIEWTGIERHGETVHLSLRNTGNVHVKITEVRHKAPEMQEESAKPEMLYLLPGKAGRVSVDLPDGNAVGTVLLETDTAGIVEYALRASP